MRKAMPIVMMAAVWMSGCQTWPKTRMDETNGPGSSKTTASSTSATSAGLPPPVFKAFPVYTDRSPRHTHYAPSGYMGDSDLTMSGSYTETPHGQGPCLRVAYKGSGPKGWAGIYWQDPANNWGDVPGRAGFDLRGATKLTFWARGENGGEKVHEFRIGGIVGQYPDSDVASMTNVRLGKEWKKYTIDLTKKDLRHIIGGFGFFVNKAESPGGMVFYMDDIIYEGPLGTGGLTTATEGSANAIVSQTPPAVLPSTGMAVPSVESSAPGSTKDLTVKTVDSGLRVSFSSQFLFAPGQAILQPSSSKILDQLIGLLSAYPNNNVLIDGHTDSTGSPQYNLKLSELRATSVRDYLIKQGGFDASRFKIIGYGDTRPVGDNTTKSGRSLNRRVEVTILKGSHS
jgi:outer membrane protein OmpA-like peptidoglycan-associated protein